MVSKDTQEDSRLEELPAISPVTVYPVLTEVPVRQEINSRRKQGIRDEWNTIDFKLRQINKDGIKKKKATTIGIKEIQNAAVESKKNAVDRGTQTQAVKKGKGTVVIKMELEIHPHNNRENDLNRVQWLKRNYCNVLQKLSAQLLLLILEIFLKSFFGLLVLFTAIKTWEMASSMIDKIGLKLEDGCPSVTWFWIKMGFQINYLMFFMHIMTGYAKPFFSYFKVSGVLSDLFMTLILINRLFDEFTIITDVHLVNTDTKGDTSQSNTFCLSIIDSVNSYSALMFHLDLPNDIHWTSIKFGKFMIILLFMWFCICMSEWRGVWLEKVFLLKRKVLIVPVHKKSRFFLYLKSLLIETGELILVVICLSLGGSVARKLKSAPTNSEFWIGLIFQSVFFAGTIRAMCVKCYLIGEKEKDNYLWERKIEAKKLSNESFLMVFIQFFAMIYMEALISASANGINPNLTNNIFGTPNFYPFLCCFVYLNAKFFGFRYFEALNAPKEISTSNRIISIV